MNRLNQTYNICHHGPRRRSLRPCGRAAIWLLWITVLLVGCSPAQPARRLETELLALQTAHHSLQQQFGQLQSRLHELDADFQRGSFFEPQVITTPLDFAAASNTLQLVQDRGQLRCGINVNAPGFGYLDPNDGEYRGFDIDICRAIAAAILGENGVAKVKLIPLTSRTRFVALQSGEVDVLVRNTTWTLSRDSTLGFDFAPVTFYDGQGVMVAADSPIFDLAGLTGQAVCVAGGTTSETNIANYSETQGLELDILHFDDSETLRTAYEEGQCQGYTGDKSGLLGQRLLLSEPAAHRILVEDISREPLGPLVRQGDDAWLDMVSWTVQCLFNAELLGIEQKNVKQALNRADLSARLLLGLEGELGAGLGLENDFCYQVVSQVGNYADIYNRNLGVQTGFNLPRGLNALYTDGGLLYPLPFR